jgi:hypothetical protein
MKNTDETLRPTSIQIGSVFILLPKEASNQNNTYENWRPIYNDNQTHLVKDGAALCRIGIRRGYKPRRQIKVSVANKETKKALESYVCKRCLATYYQNLAKSKTFVLEDNLFGLSK